MDLVDYKTILSHKGKVQGVVESCNINEFIDKLEPLVKENIKKAKGLLVEFKVNKEQSLIEINTIMEQIHDLSNDDTDIIFSTESTDIDKGAISYHLILTGL